MRDLILKIIFLDIALDLLSQTLWRRGPQNHIFKNSLGNSVTRKVWDSPAKMDTMNKYWLYNIAFK